MIVTGRYNSRLYFGNDTLPNTFEDLFIASFDSSGNKLWAKSAGENGITFALDVEINNSDEIYSLGFTQSNPIVFGDTSYNINTSSVFLNKIVPDLVSSTTNVQATNPNKKLLKIVDVLGRETIHKKNTLLFYIYSDGTVEKRIIIN